ncbi:MAG: tRNA uridine-5-carboxymethylaminomethyl(34) synthesis GTPase MnmE [Desulfuromusa sp.]|nr:tRNA uridine-5-carboxymethylaminomethyl(34) synthesis GTPase MnmE [Desulfuromusa sp.]
MNTTDTIIAPATAPGDGGIAIVRISGDDALAALLCYFRPSSGALELDSHRLYHGRLIDQSDSLVDEVMAVYMAAPHTYTRDDVVEIQCHGSQQVVKSILNLYQSYGVRLAEPGEFTFRAYMNGRLDLSQAEAVSRLIHAKTDSSRKLALTQIDGSLSREIHLFTASLKKALVLVEAWIDFPEENLPTEDLGQIAASISHVKLKSELITGSYSCGRVLSEGASILLVGQPNVGKSSLLNALLGEDRAIVTAVPGTTRDLLEEGLTIDGMPVRLVDTAGLHETSDVVEIEGIRRAQEKINQADLVLFVVDASKKLDDLDYRVQERCDGLPVFLVLTKSDAAVVVDDLSFCDFPAYRVSSKTGEGLDQLRRAISSFLAGDYLSSSESVMLTERRHYEALLFCLENLGRASALLVDSSSLELLAFELREALYHLGQISGETTTESLLDDIFSGFCIGK